MRKLIYLAILLFTGCTGLPEGIEPVGNFDAGRYLGTWYEIARFDHRFERGLSNVSAEYSLRDDGGIRVMNRGFDAEKEEWQSAEGKAFFVGDRSTGHLKVSFFGPFYASYVVIALDHDNYQWAMVTSSKRSYLWILSRTPELPQDILEQLLAKAQSLGFETDKLIYVGHEER